MITNWEPDTKKVEAQEQQKFTFPNWLLLVSKLASQKEAFGLACF